ncbi:MAG: 7TM diverse intracellular signaling domain-containing protein [Bacteroidota bacterium]
MRKYLRSAQVAMLLLTATWPLFAQYQLTPSVKHQSLDQVGYWRSADVNSDFQQALLADFKPRDFSKSNSLGFDHAVHWFKFTITNAQQATRSQLLEVAYAPLDRVDFYQTDSAGNWVHQFGGDQFPLSQRQYKNRYMVFDVAVPAAQTVTCLVRVQSRSSIQIPLHLWQPEAFHLNNYENQFAHGVFYGIMTIMVFYNFFLFLSIRDRTNVYYIFTIIFGTNVIAFFQGYSYYYLYPEHPEWGELFAALSGPLFIVASVWLTRSFLMLRIFSHTLDRTLVAVALVSLLAGAVRFVWGGPFTYTSLHLLTVLNFVLILVSAIYCFSKKFRPARYFLLAWGSILLVGVLFSLRNMGVIQGNWFANNGLYFGGIMQTLLISFALGDRINILKSESEKAKQRALEQEQQAKELLEDEVRSRTEELRVQKNRLEESNAVKDKLFSILSHDLKGPLNSLKGALGIWQMGALKPEELEKLTQSIGLQLQHTNEFLDNLLQWAKTQMKGEVVNPEPIHLHELLKMSTELLQPDFHKKNIAIQANVPASYQVYADPSMVHTVIRNLMSNALKFSQPGGVVEVRAYQKPEGIAMEVKDSGIGIPGPYLQKIFTLQGVTTTGTREEKGTGLGLVLCKDFVERNGGKIEVQSEEGKGTIFTFTLPAVNGRLSNHEPKP